MIILLAILLFLVVLGLDLYSDYKKWITNRSVDHTFEAWQRAVFLIPSAIAFHMGIVNSSIWDMGVVLMLMFFCYWFLFDGFYNVLRGYNWWFTGSDDKDDAKLDDLQQFLGIKLTKIIKISGLVISAILYIRLCF